jgi:eukaryotic-like serine/threonine-protein kinase
VICEMLTGQRPVLKDSPQWSLSLPGHGLTPRWRAVIRRCLEVRPKDRFRSVAEISLALDPRPRRRRIAWQLGTLSAFVLLAAGAMFLARVRKGEDRLQGVTQLTPGTDDSSDPSLSRDGRVIAYMSDRAQAGNLDVWVQRLPSGRPMRLTTNPAQDGDPSIAPDGKSVVFRSDRDGGGIYWSTTETIGEHLLVAGGRGPRFSPDGGHIAYWVGDEDKTVASGQLYVLSLSGGPPVRLATDFKDARQPAWSSDGQYLLFAGCRSGGQPMPACSEWWVTSRDGNTLQNTGALGLLRSQGILPKGPIAGWVADNLVFCARHGQTTSLWRLRLPEKTLVATGPPLQLTSGYATNVTESSSPADNGTIAFSRLAGALHIWRIDHATDSRLTRISKVTEDAAPDISPYISHGGRWLAFSRGSETLHDIWVRDIQSGNESLFLASSVDKASPIVDDSGETVVFEVRNKGSTAIFVIRRGQVPKLLCRGCSKPTSWFDGNHAALYREGLPSKIKIVNLETEESKIAIESADASLSDAVWSPENEYMLFTAFTEGGKKRTFAVRFPKSTRVATGDWIPIGDDRGSNDRARWSGDGKTIFYRSTLDGFSCIWAQRFDPPTGKNKGHPFVVMHFHNTRLSPQTVTPPSFDLSVFKDSVYLNLGEVSVSVWTGILNREDLTSSSKWYQW